MMRTFARPIPLVLALAVCTFIPVMTAAVSVVQIALGAWPQDSQRLASAPVAFFLHALTGVLFGVLGPLQFVRALRRRFGTVHRLAGRVFLLAGAGLALSGLGLLLQVQSITTGLLVAVRGVFGLALIAALVLGLMAARAHDMHRHRAWMIRAYAIGMGTGPVALVMFPIYLITGKPPMGLASDIVVVGMWLLTIAMGEWVIRRMAEGAGKRTFIRRGLDEREMVLKIGKSDHEAFHRVAWGEPEERSRSCFPHPRDPQPLTILWRPAGHVAEIEHKISSRSRST